MTTALKNLCKFNHKLLRHKVFKQVPVLRETLPRRLCTRNVYLVDEDQPERVLKKSSVSKFTERSHTCGELRIDHVGQNVKLCGWLEFQRMNKFAVLRDGYGQTQLLINNEDLQAQGLLKNVPLESIIEISGTVLSRPKDMINSKQATGEVEVLVDKVKVLNKAAETLPFNVREFQKAKESLRMQYRYLDLRFPQMQRNMRVRSQMIAKMREFLINNHFVDVETPTLFKATPGGAQEFVVPTRFPGQFYSLVQSPQQFKQMLMAGAIDRYFQIARCYRDEGSRPDRQPEFTQLDIEMSFTSLEGVFKLIEELLGHAWPDFLNPLPVHFQRMPYQTALSEYGTDQPDIRYDFKLKDCSSLLMKNDKLSKGYKNFGAACLVFPKEYASLTKSVKEKMSEFARSYSPSVSLVQSKVPKSKEWINKYGKLLGVPIATELMEELKVQDDSLLFLAYGEKSRMLPLLGKIRIEYVNLLENLGVSIKKKGMHILWVHDFPMFELDHETGKLQSPHHPFTAPHPDDLHLLESNPLKVRSLAYDLVLNGNEIGGGSIRIHDPVLQKTVLNMLQIDAQFMQHILNMLGSGCPPHGGIALGLDRLLAMILNTTSIRDVIAFPKTFEGKDPVSGAPSPIGEKEQKLYHIKPLEK